MAADPYPAQRDRWRWLQHGLPYISVLVFLVIWQVVGEHIDPILLATPVDTAKAFCDLLTSASWGRRSARRWSTSASGTVSPSWSAW